MFTVKKAAGKKEYLEFRNAVPGFMGGSFLQSWEWGTFLKKAGNKIERLVIEDEKGAKIGRLTTILVKILPFFGYAYSPFGPVLDYKKLSKQELRAIFEALKDYIKKKRGIFLRFNPPLEDSYPLKGLDWRISKAKTKQPQETLYLDLTKNKEDLLSEMKAKTRYNIRLAQKKKLLVKKGFSKGLAEDFLKLSRETSERNKFSLHTEEYYRKMVDCLGKKGLLKVYAAYFKGEPIAANLVVFYNGTATYLHGASADQHRNLMAPYLLQWKAILAAREKGLKYYDFWGIDEKKWPGVTRFKLGFGGKRIKLKPTYEMRVLRLKYAFYGAARKASGK